MSKRANSHSVLIAALVAVVAVVGMVTFFSTSGSQGAQTIILPAFEDTITAQSGRLYDDYADYDKGNALGIVVADACLEKAPYPDITECCKMDCVPACADPYNDLCQEKCANRCQNVASQAMGSELRYR